MQEAALDVQADAHEAEIEAEAETAAAPHEAEIEAAAESAADSHQAEIESETERSAERDSEDHDSIDIENDHDDDNYSERAEELQKKITEHWRDGTIRQTPFAQQTIIQVFYTRDGSHREEDSVLARVGHVGWKNVRIMLPRDAAAAPLRIDFVSALTTIEISSIRLVEGEAEFFSAAKKSDFDSIAIGGDAERLPDAELLRFRITGIDPQLYLPAIELPAGEAPLTLQLRLRVVSAL